MEKENKTENQFFIEKITNISQNHAKNLPRKIYSIKRRYNINNDQIEGKLAEDKLTVNDLAAVLKNMNKKSKNITGK